MADPALPRTQTRAGMQTVFVEGSAMTAARALRSRTLRAPLLICWALIASSAVPASASFTAAQVESAGVESDCTAFAQVSGGCTPVEPGGGVKFPGFACTLNFLWRGSDGARYIGTAGHCTVGSAVGTPALDYQGHRIGALAYRLFDFRNIDPALHDDFALIRIDPKVPASGAVAVWGGPTKTYTGLSPSPVHLRFVGRGLGAAAVAPARRAVATAVTSPFLIHFIGPANFSDSGAPVTTADGQAVGVLTGLARVGDGPSDFIRGNASSGYEVGSMWTTRLPRQVALAEKALGIKLKLETAAPTPGTR